MQNGARSNKWMGSNVINSSSLVVVQCDGKLCKLHEEMCLKLIDFEEKHTEVNYKTNWPNNFITGNSN